MLKYLLYMHIAFSVIICQENYRSIEQIESEWGDYTKFQRDEMISFCDFLFNEGYYERCLISSFQFLYRLPDTVKGVNGENINTKIIPLNESTVKELRKISLGFFL